MKVQLLDQVFDALAGVLADVCFPSPSDLWAPPSEKAAINESLGLFIPSIILYKTITSSQSSVDAIDS